jgi:hypothetical protein
MALPGFSGETSLYASSLAYFGGPAAQATGGPAAQATHLLSTIRLAADSCVCTSPNCTWSCPVPPPPNCTTTGCRPGLVCCDCGVGPPFCTTRAGCKFFCASAP